MKKYRFVTSDLEIYLALGDIYSYCIAKNFIKRIHEQLGSCYTSDRISVNGTVWGTRVDNNYFKEHIGTDSDFILTITDETLLEDHMLSEMIDSLIDEFGTVD